MRRATVLVAWSVAVSAVPASARQVDRAPSGEGHGVSLDLARRRATQVRGISYALTLDVTARDSAPGAVRIRFDRLGGDDLVLDYRGRRLLTVMANGALAPVTFDGNHLRIPARALRAGLNTVDVTFVSEIAPSGASIIRTHDATDNSDYLYTLLVPADANQLFPCFDQPDLKARVTLTLRAPRAWEVVGNGSVASQADSAGVRITRFTETRPLSTYLVAFAAGPWVKYDAASGGRTLHLYARRSRSREVDADSLLELSSRALQWMEGYFGRPYPFEKFDLLLAPAFPFGGMEHPGLVMYNEDRFIFRDRPTVTRRIGRFSTILHETAHQWFGDLVTMRWFDDLWLKEGFATYMGAKALAELEPAAGAWRTFYQSNKPAAYAVDQTAGTTSLWQPLDNLDQAKSAYGAIVYNKAPSVLKQLNYLVGDDAFRRGVRAFLTTHAYANATWQQLLDAIGSAGARPMEAFGENFMKRPGVPIVDVELATQKGRITRLALRQRPARAEVSGAAPWPMRTQVLIAWSDGRRDTMAVELKGAVTEVTAAKGKPAPRFVFPNVGDYGYFIALLDSASTRAIVADGVHAEPDAFLRTMLWGALWDQVRFARMQPEMFGELVVRELPLERDEQVLPALLSRLERTIRAYAVPPASDRLRDAAEGVLWRLARDSSAAFGVRRNSLDAFVAIAASDSARARLLGLLDAESVGSDPIRDPLRWDVAQRLLVLGDPRADAAIARQAARDTSADGLRRRFTIEAARPSADAKAALFRRFFADSTINEDWVTASLGAFVAVEHEQLTLPLLRASLDSLPYIQANRRIFFLGSWVSSFLNGQTSDAASAVVAEWLRSHPKIGLDIRQKVLQSADELDRTVAIRRRASLRP